MKNTCAGTVKIQSTGRRQRLTRSADLGQKRQLGQIPTNVRFGWERSSQGRSRRVAGARKQKGRGGGASSAAFFGAALGVAIAGQATI